MGRCSAHTYRTLASFLLLAVCALNGIIVYWCWAGAGWIDHHVAQEDQLFQASSKEQRQKMQETLKRLTRSKYDGTGAATLVELRGKNGQADGDGARIDQQKAFEVKAIDTEKVTSCRAPQPCVQGNQHSGTNLPRGYHLLCKGTPYWAQAGCLLGRKLQPPITALLNSSAAEYGRVCTVEGTARTSRIVCVVRPAGPCEVRCAGLPGEDAREQEGIQAGERGPRVCAHRLHRASRRGTGRHVAVHLHAAPRGCAPAPQDAARDEGEQQGGQGDDLHAILRSGCGMACSCVLSGTSQLAKHMAALTRGQGVHRAQAGSQRDIEVHLAALRPRALPPILNRLPSMPVLALFAARSRQ